SCARARELLVRVTQAFAAPAVRLAGADDRGLLAGAAAHAVRFRVRAASGGGVRGVARGPAHDLSAPAATAAVRPGIHRGAPPARRKARSGSGRALARADRAQGPRAPRRALSAQRPERASIPKSPSLAVSPRGCSRKLRRSKVVIENSRAGSRRTGGGAPELTAGCRLGWHTLQAQRPSPSGEPSSRA